MILLIHIIIAITSVIYTLALYNKPTTLRLRTSYGLLFVTIASGGYLIFANHSRMIETCTVGLLYIIVVSTSIAAARRKLALYSARSK